MRGTTGISKVSAGATLASGADVLTALVAAQNKMDEDEVPQTERYLYITPTLYNYIMQLTRRNQKVLNSFARVVKTPQSRFIPQLISTMARLKTKKQVVT